MTDTQQQGLRVVREGAPFRGKQGHVYRPAISAEAVGSQALHMQLLEIAPGERAHAGDFVYIAADVPHLPYNRSRETRVVAVIARTDPNEQESVVLLPALEAGVDWSLAN